MTHLEPVRRTHFPPFPFFTNSLLRSINSIHNFGFLKISGNGNDFNRLVIPIDFRSSFLLAFNGNGGTMNAQSGASIGREQPALASGAR